MKTIVHPNRIVVDGQGEEPYSIGIVNASHGLLALRANDRCAWLAFVNLLFRTAGTRSHIRSALRLRVRVKARSVCFVMGDDLFSASVKYRPRLLFIPWPKILHSVLGSILA